MPLTLPLYAAGEVYETFQTTVGIGTPPQFFNLTLVSTAPKDMVLSAGLTHDYGTCSKLLLDRSAFFHHNLSTSFKPRGPYEEEPWNPFWETSSCGPFSIDRASFADDVKAGQMSISSYYIHLILVENVTGTFVDGWRGAGFLTLRYPAIISSIISQSNCVLIFDGNNTRDYSPFWALGTSFLKPYCLVVDYERQKVSFAKIPGMTYEDSSPTTPTTPATSGPLSTLAIVAIAALSIMIVCVASGLVVICKYRRKVSSRRNHVPAPPSTKYYFINRFMRWTSVDPGYDEYELRATDIRVSDVLLGEGAYGVVYKGTLVASRRLGSGNTTTSPGVTGEVAVKMLHSHANDQARDEFRREICILKEVSSHPHVLNIVGCITGGRDPVLVTELCSSGDLLATVRRHKTCIVSDTDLCKLEDGVCAIRRRLISFAWQICNGMVFLASKKLVHRDLAARNILLTSQKVAKIADFGMCLHEGSVASAETRKVPVRWTAPEALRSGAYSQASDVWSYGILLYELFSGGEMPYSGGDVEKLVDFLEEGGRLKRPETCPNELYDIMSKCWVEAADERPSFDGIRSSLAVILEQRSYLYGYIDATEHYWRPNPET